MKPSKIKTARDVIRIERDSLTQLLTRIDGRFKKACDLILHSKGRVVVTGVGKPGFIAQKISATLSSTGTPSLFLHPSEALHGDLGRVTKEDVVIILSNSGQTEEIVKLLPVLKKIGAKIITLTGNPKSQLAHNSHVVIDVGVKKEACPMNLAPSASTTNMLAMGDALAMSLLTEKNFKPEDFALYHPGGNIGKKLLLKVSDIMRSGSSHAVVSQNIKIKDVLLKITKARAGSATIIGPNKKLAGIFTDGDLRRHVKDDKQILEKSVSTVMTRKPTTIAGDRLAVEALEILRHRRIDEIPVVDKSNRPIGLLDIQDLLKAGFI